MQAGTSTPQNVAPRFTLNLPMRYRVQGQLKWHNTNTVNVSASGLLFVARERLAKGTKLEVEISMTAANLKPTHLAAISEVLRQGTTEEPLLTTVRHVGSKTLDGDIEIG